MKENSIPDLDQLDLMIIKELQIDGRQTNTELARKLSVSRTTVRSKLQRLLDEHVISINAVANPPLLGYEIMATIVRLSKDGLKTSEIGVRLRDEYGIPLVKPILGKSLTEALREAGVSNQIPEDLYELLTRAKKLAAHLENHKSDRKNVRSLELLEAKIHRLSRYYKRNRRLPSDWKTSTMVAQLA